MLLWMGKLVRYRKMALSRKRLEQEIKTIYELIDKNEEIRKESITNNEVNELVLKTFEDALAIYNKRNKAGS